MPVIKNLPIDHKNGYCRIKIPDFINQKDLLQIQSRIDMHLKGSNDQVVVDLAQLSYINSLTISLILRLRERVIETGGKFYLINVSDICYQRFELIHLEKVLQFVEDENELFS